MSHPQNDEFYEQLRIDREQFLSDFGASENDVLEDERGEYFYLCLEGSDCTELTHSHPKVYLPATLQKDYVPF